MTTSINGNNNGTDRLDLLTDQIGRLTEQIAQSNIVIANGFAETRTIVESGFSELKEGLSELKTIAQAQQQDINRLVGVVDKLADTTAQQAKILERLLSDRVQNN